MVVCIWLHGIPFAKFCNCCKVQVRCTLTYNLQCEFPGSSMPNKSIKQINDWPGTGNKLHKPRFRSCFIIELFLVGWGLSYWLGKNPACLVDLVDQLFQPDSHQVETVEKAFGWLCYVIVTRVRLFPGATRVQPKTAGKMLFWETSYQSKPVTVKMVHPNRTQP